MNKEVERLERAAYDIRKNLLRLCSVQNIHIGGDLSVADVMTVLWQYKIKYDPGNLDWEERDRFVLSKGHAAAVTAFNQAAIGCFDAEDVIKEYASDWGRFSMHSCNLVNPYVEVSTGSLGHGLPVACGMAAALRLKGNKTSFVYTVMGDGEQSEGSIWEAVMNAAHYKLGNLVAFIDNNGLQADGFVDELTAIGSLEKKYEAFGWNVISVNGNDIAELVEVMDNLPDATSLVPTAVICHTVKGSGVSSIENVPRWHAGKMSQEQYVKSLEELSESFNKSL